MILNEIICKYYFLADGLAGLTLTSILRVVKGHRVKPYQAARMVRLAESIACVSETGTRWPRFLCLPVGYLYKKFNKTSG